MIELTSRNGTDQRYGLSLPIVIGTFGPISGHFHGQSTNRTSTSKRADALLELIEGL